MTVPALTNQSVAEKILANEDLSDLNIIDYDYGLNAYDIFTHWAAATPDNPLTRNQARFLKKVWHHLPSTTPSFRTTTKILIEKESWTALTSLHQRMKSPLATIHVLSDLFPAQEPYPPSPIFCRIASRRILDFITRDLQEVLRPVDIQPHLSHIEIMHDKYRRRGLSQCFCHLRKAIHALGSDVFFDARLIRYLNQAHDLLEEIKEKVALAPKFVAIIDEDAKWMKVPLHRAALDSLAKRSNNSSAPIQDYQRPSYSTKM